MAIGDTARFGEQPLAQTVAPRRAAAPRGPVCCRWSIRTLRATPMVEQLARWENELADAVAPTPPAIGEDGADTQRVYLVARLRHRRVQPVLSRIRIRPHRCRDGGGPGHIPVVYEGPPGLVHGGFLAVFFDCVIQHQNCATELSGKTRSLNVTFRRPHPSSPSLRFDIARPQVDRGSLRRAAAARRRGAVHRRSHDARALA
jgi:acyl-coenzyme A thioesterase PaaI-like protein